MRYEEARPSAELDGIVDRLWVLEGEAHELTADPILPDGCTEIIVHLGTPFAQVTRAGAEIAQERVLLAGQMTRALTVRPRGHACVVGARLRPDAAFRLLRVPQHDVTDQVTPLRDLHRTLARRLREDVATRASADDARHALAAAITAIAPSPGRDLLGHIVTVATRRRGLVSVSDLARDVRLGARQLERLFRERIGVSPKAFLRTLRFQEVLRSMHREGASATWAQRALAHGFYDQAHFIRDFRQFTGVAPSAWRVSDESLAAVFSAIRREPAHDMRDRAY